MRESLPLRITGGFGVRRWQVQSVLELNRKKITAF